MSNELKPCPFCNSKAEMHFDKLAGKTIYMVKCSIRECQCQEMGWHESESKATSAWNSRPIEDKLQSELDKLNKALDLACDFVKDVCGDTAPQWKEYYIKKAGE